MSRVLEVVLPLPDRKVTGVERRRGEARLREAVDVAAKAAGLVPESDPDFVGVQTVTMPDGSECAAEIYRVVCGRADVGSAETRMLLWVVAFLAAIMILGEAFSPQCSAPWLAAGIVVVLVVGDRLYMTRPDVPPPALHPPSNFRRVRPPFRDWRLDDPELLDGVGIPSRPRPGTVVDVRCVDRPLVDEWIADGLIGRVP